MSSTELRLDDHDLVISQVQQAPNGLDGDVDSPRNPADSSAEHGLIDDKEDPPSGTSASKPSETPSIPPKTSPRVIGLHRVASLSDLTLHSPSNIVGTPFDVTSPRFEYPFPTNDESSPDSDHPLSASLPSLSSPLSHSNPSSSSLLSAPFSLSPFPPALPHNMSYSTTHPKLRLSAGQHPPVPPGLAQKRHRWTLGLQAQNDSDGSVNSIVKGAGAVHSAKLAAGRDRGADDDDPSSNSSDVTSGSSASEPGSVCIFACSMMTTQHDNI